MSRHATRSLARWQGLGLTVLAGLATLVVFARPGVAVPPLPWPSRTVPVPGVEISATGVRARVAAGLPIRYWVPDPVAGFISANGLYLADA